MVWEGRSREAPPYPDAMCGSFATNEIGRLCDLCRAQRLLLGKAD